MLSQKSIKAFYQEKDCGLPKESIQIEYRRYFLDNGSQ